jgi:hypothetical protein
MKVSGTYDSVVLGVSEQVAHDRRSGQHTEQVNMISDPVHGLARRRGSVYQAELAVAGGSLSQYADEAGAMREYTFVIDGVAYSLLYRKQASTKGKPTFMYLYNKTEDKFIPIVYDDSDWVNELVSGGVSALANVGRYLYIAGNTTIPSIDIHDKWGDESNTRYMVAWVRGGAYSRTFSLTLSRPDGSTLRVEYTTKASAYPELLDISDIPFWADPPTNSEPREDYQKDVNDRVYLYQSKVNEWIGIAAQDITGENIADKLRDELVANGVNASVRGSTVIISDTDFIDISADDGGDGTLIRAVGREVTQPTLMSTHHRVGKVVRIRPQGSSDSEAYYLQAYAKDGVSTGWTEVVWREGAGVVQTPTAMFAQAVIHNDTLYVAQDAASLSALAPGSGEHVEYKASAVGDPVSSPTPNFFGRQITMMTVFQDRLLIGSGGTVNASRPGDYLNFFRQTVLTILDNDSIEMFSYGSEGDTLRSAVVYDKDLILFGDLRQYGVSGRSVLSAKSPNITTISAHEDAAAAHPVASGNFVFYGKDARADEGDLRTTLHQLQIGQLLESPVSYEVSQQLDQYIKGTPAQLVALTSPNVVLMRTEQQASDVYVYSYVDSQDGGQRLLDSWSRWSYNPALGRICGLSTHKGSVLVFTLRQRGAQLVVVADKQSLNSQLGSLPYLDSARRGDQIVAGSWHATVQANRLCFAVDRTSEHFLLGSSYDRITDFRSQVNITDAQYWVGVVSDGWVTPTNPYRRDQNGVAVLSGRLTLTQVRPSVTQTSGLVATVDTSSGRTTTMEFNGRIIGSSDNRAGQQPTPTTQVTIGVGKEVRECSYTLATKEWQPLTITAIEWTGQAFNRVRRA